MERNESWILLVYRLATKCRIPANCSICSFVGLSALTPNIYRDNLQILLCGILKNNWYYTDYVIKCRILSLRSACSFITISALTNLRFRIVCDIINQNWYYSASRTIGFSKNCRDLILCQKTKRHPKNGWRFSNYETINNLPICNWPDFHLAIH